MASPYEKVLGAELVGVIGVQTLDAFSGANTGKFSFPDPSRYFATVIVFAMLSGMAMFGESWGKLASRFGGVALLGMVAIPSKVSGRAPIMGALAYFDQLITGGVQGISGTSTTTIVPGGSVTTGLPSGATVTTPANFPTPSPTTVSGGPSAAGNPSGLA
jgi:hypothetical protein